MWIPCEVKPGPFPDERLVRLRSAFGDWIGFVRSEFLKSPIEEGSTEIQGLVVELKRDRFLVKLPGESVSASRFQGALSAGVTHIAPIEA